MYSPCYRYPYFLRFARMKLRQTSNAQASEAKVASHRPSMPRMAGIIRMAAICKISVRRKEMAAETVPSFRAVNIEEVKIFSPTQRNAGL